MPRPAGHAGASWGILKSNAHSVARTAALTHAMADCLSVELYRQTHGGLPETLEDAHVDPFTGQSLKYRRENGGYVI
jgi:hypothetical protein